MRLTNTMLSGEARAHALPTACLLEGMMLAANVWAERGELYLYFSQSGTFDENSTMLKLGRFKVKIDDGEIFSKNFVQKLNLYDGYITIDAGEEGDRVHFDIWAATHKSEVSIDITSDKKHNVSVVFDSWRYKERPGLR